MSGIGARLTNNGKRERFLSVFGALFMMILFVLWSTALIIGFGLLQWSLEGGVHGPDGRAWKLSEAIYMSGVTFFTLGYGDVCRTPPLRASPRSWKPAWVLASSPS